MAMNSCKSKNITIKMAHAPTMKSPLKKSIK